MAYPYPTTAQAFKCVELCHRLSNLGRYNSISGSVFILTANETAVIVDRDGIWEFEDET